MFDSPCYNSTWKVGGNVNVILTSVISRLLYMNTVNTFHLEYLCTLGGKWKITTGRLYCLELAQSYKLPGLRNGIRKGFFERFFSYFSLMLSHSPSPLVGPGPTLMSPFCHAGLIIQHSIFNLSLFQALQISLQLLS